MNLDDVLGRTATRVADVTTSTAKSAADLGSDTAVEATGAATRVVDRAQSKSPAAAAAILALAALGGIVAMRFAFAGAVS